MSGSLVTSTATFAGESGPAADPTTITLKYKAGSGATVTAVYPAAPVTRVAQGVYQAELDTSGFTGPDAQLWVVQWAGAGNVQAVGADYWQVTPPAL